MHILLFVLLLGGKADTALVGSWGLNGQPFLTFAANGKGDMQGEAFGWSTAGGVVTFTSPGDPAETAAYQVSGDQLQITMGGIPMTLARIGGKAAAPAKSGADPAPAKAGKTDAALVGSWTMQIAGAQPVIFEKGGKGSYNGSPFTWTTKDGVVTATSPDGHVELEPYVISGDQLTLTYQGIPLQLKKDAKTAKAPASGGTATKGGKAGSDPLSQLLLKYGWCSSSYNQNTGYSSTSKVVFAADGTWWKAARGEGYSSGSGGTFASQHDAQDSGRWESRAGGNQLWMSGAASGGQLVQVPAGVEKNSSGWPILTILGVEYQTCD